MQTLCMYSDGHYIYLQTQFGEDHTRTHTRMSTHTHTPNLSAIFFQVNLG